MDQLLVYLTDLPAGWPLALTMAFLAATIQRATGFGFGMIFMSGFLPILPPIEAVTIASIANALLTVVASAQLRRDIDWGFVRALMPSLAVGTLLGLLTYAIVVDWVVEALALGVICWTIWQVANNLPGVTARWSREPLAQDDDPRKQQVSAKSIAWPGLFGGYLGFMLSMPGPTIVGYMHKIAMDAINVRATLMLIFLVVSLFRLVLGPVFFGLEGFPWALTFWGTASVVVGSGVGTLLGRWLHPSSFAWVQLFFITLSGILIASGLWAAAQVWLGQ